MRVAPSPTRFAELARDAGVVPLCAEIVADDLTPVMAFARLRQTGNPFLLESVIGGERWARYSFVGVDPAQIVVGRGEQLEVYEDGALVRTEEGGLKALRRLLADWNPPPADALEDLDLPRFWGGAVGGLRYDIVARFEKKVPRLASKDETDFTFGIGATLVVFDGLRQTLRIIVPQRVDEEGAYERALARIDAVRERLTCDVPRLPSVPLPSEVDALELPPSSFERGAFCEAVERCKEHIRAGDIFQVVLSQRFELQQKVDPFALYRALRVVNPSPYMFHVSLPELVVSGASPETLVRVEDGVATLRPIAGTRPRGASREEDEAHERSLLADAKERAEHVMLVDLGRNDLGRVAEVGGVRITGRMFIERYSHVMHMTSNLEGTLREDVDVFDVLAAVFPAGTLSGAPKVRAMQIIADLEPVPRGIYGGAVGYIGFDGSADLAIAIRSAEFTNDGVAVQAGAGIVEASVPESEYDETLHKARAALTAVAMAKAMNDPGPK